MEAKQEAVELEEEAGQVAALATEEIQSHMCSLPKCSLRPDQVFKIWYLVPGV